MAEYLEHPLAYHITFGTYGTRLHGDESETVSRERDRFGEPIVGKDVVWQTLERAQLKFPPVVLNRKQRLHSESVVPGICTRELEISHHCRSTGPRARAADDTG